MVATPGPTPGALAHTTKSRGTSNATALASRAAAMLHPVLGELRLQENGSVIDLVPTAVWLKALLVHGARWGEAGGRFRELLKTDADSRKLPEHLGRFIGYGVVNTDDVRECTATRVTALAGSLIRRDQGIEHRFPLPPSLSGRRGWRRLVVTLAWLTPVYSLSHRWRRAHLWFSSPSSKLQVGSSKHLERTASDWQAAQRGTVQHEVFEGEKAGVFVEGDDIVVQVNCREDAAVLTDAVPYALAVTLEVSAELGIDIYTEIRDRVRGRTPIAPTPDALT
jgi:hypothetical protein